MSNQQSINEEIITSPRRLPPIEITSTCEGSRKNYIESTYDFLGNSRQPGIKTKRRWSESLLKFRSEMLDIFMNINTYYYESGLQVLNMAVCIFDHIMINYYKQIKKSYRSDTQTILIALASYIISWKFEAGEDDDNRIRLTKPFFGIFNMKYLKSIGGIKKIVKQINKCEYEILNIIKFNLFFPTACSMLSRPYRSLVSQLDEDPLEDIAINIMQTLLNPEMANSSQEEIYRAIQDKTNICRGSEAFLNYFLNMYEYEIGDDFSGICNDISIVNMIMLSGNILTFECLVLVNIIKIPEKERDSVLLTSPVFSTITELPLITEDQQYKEINLSENQIQDFLNKDDDDYDIAILQEIEKYLSSHLTTIYKITLVREYHVDIIMSSYNIDEIMYYMEKIFELIYPTGIICNSKNRVFFKYTETGLNKRHPTNNVKRSCRNIIESRNVQESGFGFKKMFTNPLHKIQRKTNALMYTKTKIFTWKKFS
ncbi:MAG: hypothetical protein JKX76_01605 [Colwellia sp.]|nr:hypothetical protein [Colwellia sp.]